MSLTVNLNDAPFQVTPSTAAWRGELLPVHGAVLRSRFGHGAPTSRVTPAATPAPSASCSGAPAGMAAAEPRNWKGDSHD